MHDNIYTYLVRFPSRNIHEAILPCSDGYTIYIDERLSREQQMAVFRHALVHIERGDFSNRECNVDRIEYEAHSNRKGE